MGRGTVDVFELKGKRAVVTGAANGFGCDVSNEASVTKAFAEVGGPVDILVNCAGIAHIGTLASTTPEDLDRLYAVNVRGTFLAMRAVIDGMTQASRGVMVHRPSVPP